MPDTRLAGERIIAATENRRAPFTVAYTSLTTNATADPGGAEAVWLTSVSATYRAGRAYRVTLKGLAVATVANTDCQLRVRRAALGGSLLFDSFRFALPSTANIAFYFANVFVVAGAVDITAVLVGTISRAFGSGVVTVNASAVNTAYIHVEDVGPAGDFSGATAIS
ncbi:hypothetical protein OG599_35155 (plasmid) [Streptomyces sp. NBC_01335]|uniref:hypothetical protein n=1 Tax=Streptomyces sp. NBC_01335 TaxID=2903828 RepID=UPI002E11D722|nr:hypothetical protein OG599_35155 [Streptomyces sp. NBC_01335]